MGDDVGVCVGVVVFVGVGVGVTDVGVGVGVTGVRVGVGVIHPLKQIDPSVIGPLPYTVP